MDKQKKGSLIVISAPSGGGKGTIIRELIKRNKNLKLSISATTRPKRTGEIDGKDYYFLSKEEFLKKAETGDMLEYAKYCNNYYGTPRAPIEEWISQGYSVVLEIEVIGAALVLEKIKGVISIFILPPSIDALKERLLKRGTDKENVIDLRLERAKEELKTSENYKYVVINDDVIKCTEEIENLLSRL